MGQNYEWPAHCSSLEMVTRQKADGLNYSLQLKATILTQGYGDLSNYVKSVEVRQNNASPACIYERQIHLQVLPNATTVLTVGTNAPKFFTRITHWKPTYSMYKLSYSLNSQPVICFQYLIYFLYKTTSPFYDTDSKRAVKLKVHSSAYLKTWLGEASCSCVNQLRQAADENVEHNSTCLFSAYFPAYLFRADLYLFSSSSVKVPSITSLSVITFSIHSINPNLILYNI